MSEAPPGGTGGCASRSRIKQVRQCLRFLGPGHRDRQTGREFVEDRALWLKIGMCLRELDIDGLDLWIRWSKGSRKFNEMDCRRRWSEFGSGSLTVGTVIYLARDQGWRG